jgi:hypothetical protein
MCVRVGVMGALGYGAADFLWLAGEGGGVIMRYLRVDVLRVALYSSIRTDACHACIRACIH